jgi:shikimate dehydrogenase
MVIGAGGAARATVWALAALGASSVLVLNRTVSRADDLVADFRPHFTEVELNAGPLDFAAARAQKPWAVIVNATSLGHHGSAPDVHPSCYSRDSVAIELAYNPPLTAFMVAARANGARAENGLGMLLHQAALAFECWTGQEPPMDVYEAVLAARVTT